MGRRNVWCGLVKIFPYSVLSIACFLCLIQYASACLVFIPSFLSISSVMSFSSPPFSSTSLFSSFLPVRYLLQCFISIILYDYSLPLPFLLCPFPSPPFSSMSLVLFPSSSAIFFSAYLSSSSYTTILFPCHFFYYFLFSSLLCPFSFLSLIFFSACPLSSPLCSSVLFCVLPSPYPPPPYSSSSSVPVLTLLFLASGFFPVDSSGFPGEEMPDTTTHDFCLRLGYSNGA